MNKTDDSASDRSRTSGPSWAFIAVTAGFLVSVALIVAVGVVALDLS